MTLGMKGIKVYPVIFYMTGPGRYNALNVEFDSNLQDLEFLNLLIDFANKHNLIFGMHSSQVDVNSLIGFLYQSNYRYAQKLKVLFFHAFAPQDLAVLNLLKDHLSFKPNARIFIELSTSELNVNGPLKNPYIKLVNSIGTDHLLFGSDSISWSGFSEQSQSLKLYKTIFKKSKLDEILNNPKIFE